MLLGVLLADPISKVRIHTHTHTGILMTFWYSASDKDDVLDGISRFSLLGIGAIGIITSQTKDPGEGIAE